MSPIRLTAGWVAIAILSVAAVPAQADQVFSTVSTGGVHARASDPPYPLGDVYYAPCGWNGTSGRGSRNRRPRHTERNGGTTITGERFYPYDIASNGDRSGGRRGRGHGNQNGYCSGPMSGYNPRPTPRPGSRKPGPPPRRYVPQPYASPRR